jgi:hypothetical protein
MSVTKGSFEYATRDDVSREGELSGFPVYLYTPETRRFVSLDDPLATLNRVTKALGLSGEDKGLHICATANKDFSIIALGGFVPPHVADLIRDQRRQLVQEWAEKRLEKSFIRKGADGREHIPASPEVVLMFAHSFSCVKADDTIRVVPHDHYHVIKSGTCRTADGRTGQDACLRNNWFRTQAADRAEDLKRQETILNDNGIRTERRGNGFIVPEIPRDFVRRMSPGAERIREAISELGLEHTPYAADVAARLRPDRDRMPASEVPTLEEARREWQAVAKFYAFERVEVREIPRLSERDAKFAAAAVVKQSIQQLHEETGSYGFSPAQLKQAALENSLGVHGLTADQVIAEVKLAYQHPKTHGLERGRLDNGAPVLRLANPDRDPFSRGAEQTRRTERQVEIVAQVHEATSASTQTDGQRAGRRAERTTDRSQSSQSSHTGRFQPAGEQERDGRGDTPRPEYVLDAKDYRGIDRFLRDHDRRSYLERALKSIALGISQQWGDFNRGLAFGEHLFRQYTRDNGRDVPPQTIVVVKNSHYLNRSQSRRLTRLAKRQDVSLSLQFREATFQKPRERHLEQEIER